MRIERRNLGSLLVLAAGCMAILALSASRGSAATSANPEPAALSQYVDADGFHWSTTGVVSSGYSLQSTLGFLSPTDGSDNAALYGCQETSDTDVHFLSQDSGCKGQTVLGMLGYVYTSAPTSTASVGLYACSDGPDQFASNDPTCGGDTVVGQLGYLLTSQALVRYNDGYHWVTTGTAPDGYAVEATLGFLTTGGSGTQALYGCQNGSDQQLSLDPTCGGLTVLGLEGYVYSAAPATPASTELFLCSAGASDFASTDPECEGQTVVGPLGWMLQAPLPAPAPAPTSTETTPQTTTVPAAAPTPPVKGKRTTPRIRVAIALAWTWSGAVSRLHAIRFLDKIPSGSSITVTCSGKRCPKNLGTTATRAKHKRLKLAALLTRFKSDVFRVGQRILIVVAHTGDISLRTTLTIRYGRLPLKMSVG